MHLGDRSAARPKVFSEAETIMLGEEFKLPKYKAYGGAAGGVQHALEVLLSSINARRAAEGVPRWPPTVTIKQLASKRTAMRRSWYNEGPLLARTVPPVADVVLEFVDRARLSLNIIPGTDGFRKCLSTLLHDNNDTIVAYVTQVLESIKRILAFTMRDVSTINEGSLSNRRLDFVRLFQLEVINERSMERCASLRVLADFARRLDQPLVYPSVVRSVADNDGAAAVLATHRVLALDVLDAVGHVVQRRDASGLPSADGAAAAAVPLGADLPLTPLERTRLDEVLAITASDLDDTESFLLREQSKGSLCAAYNVVSYAVHSVLDEVRDSTSVTVRSEFHATPREKDLDHWYMKKVKLVEQYEGLFYVRPAFFELVGVLCYALTFMVVQYPTGNTDVQRVEALMAHDDVKSAVTAAIEAFVVRCDRERRLQWDAAKKAKHNKNVEVLAQRCFDNVIRVFLSNLSKSIIKDAVVQNSEKLISEQVDAKNNDSLRGAIAAGGPQRKRERKSKSKSKSKSKAKNEKKRKRARK